MSALVRYELEDGIATITLDDGKANVMSPKMLGELAEALDRAEADRAVVLLIGREGIFSGGFDLRVFEQGPDEALKMLEAGARMTERLLSFPRPVVAACTGNAIAMGVFLLLSADLRIGVDAQVRLHINEVRIGMTLPRFAIEVSRQRLAPAHLQRAAVTGTPYSPREAVAAGLLDEVAAPDEIATAARERARDLLEVHADAFTATKLGVRRDTLEALRSAIEQDIRDWQAAFGGGA